jgi:hypothetical protein
LYCTGGGARRQLPLCRAAPERGWCPRWQEEKEGKEELRFSKTGARDGKITTTIIIYLVGFIHTFKDIYKVHLFYICNYYKENCKNELWEHS